MDPATRLGVPPGADAAIIRAAFARRVRAVHPDVAAPGRADPASDVADLLAARDQLLAQPRTSPRLHPGPVVFYQRPNLIGALRASLRRRGQPRRNLC
jgi:hypothetical protein